MKHTRTTIPIIAQYARDSIVCNTCAGVSYHAASGHEEWLYLVSATKGERLVGF